MTNLQVFISVHRGVKLPDDEPALSDAITEFVMSNCNDILSEIPETWMYSEDDGGDNPTKYGFAWWYVWEQVANTR